MDVIIRSEIDKFCQSFDNTFENVRREINSSFRELRNLAYAADISNKSHDSDICDISKTLQKLQIKPENVVQAVCAKPTSEENNVLRIHFLKMYPPSDAIKQAQIGDFSAKALSANNEQFCTYLKSPTLNPGNIDVIYKTLLEIEDLANMLPYTVLAQTGISLNQGNGREFWIAVPKSPSTQYSVDDILTAFMDEVVIIPRASTLATPTPESAVDILLPHPHEGAITDTTLHRIVTPVVRVQQQRVYFRLSKPQSDAINLALAYDIVFRSCRIPMRYQHRALELLAAQPKLRHYLFPSWNMHKQLASIDLQLINSEISSNPEQLQAVRNIVEGPNAYAPYIIFGPPGTGKTTTIVESIIQLRLLRPRSRILVTAGSNAACDTIALRICKYFKSNPAVVERLKQQQPSRYAAANRNAVFQPLMRIFSKSIIRNGLALIASELLEHSNVQHGIHSYPEVEELSQYGILVVTLCTVGKLVAAGLGQCAPPFTHIFIDEAGASTECEALVGIMGIKSGAGEDCRIILSGDHKQLGPVLKSKRAEELGLGLSLMERLLQGECYTLDKNGNYDESLQTRLRRNYRSHSEIVRLYNHLYYHNELLAVAKKEDVDIYGNWNVLANPQFPIIFQAVHGKTSKHASSPSSYNALEIQVLLWYLAELLVNGISGQPPVRQSDIGIISPYRLQCRIISQQLKSLGWTGIETGSVESFQGREKPIIIVSLVRSFSGLGFVSNPRRLNVVLSRAKSLLILIGNPVTLRRNDDFKFIIDECIRKGTLRRKKKSLTASQIKSKTTLLTENLDNLNILKPFSLLSMSSLTSMSSLNSSTASLTSATASVTSSKSSLTSSSSSSLFSSTSSLTSSTFLMVESAENNMKIKSIELQAAQNSNAIVTTAVKKKLEAIDDSNESDSEAIVNLTDEDSGVIDDVDDQETTTTLTAMKSKSQSLPCLTTASFAEIQHEAVCLPPPKRRYSKSELLNISKHNKSAPSAPILPTIHPENNPNFTNVQNPKKRRYIRCRNPTTGRYVLQRKSSTIFITSDLESADSKTNDNLANTSSSDRLAIFYTIVRRCDKCPENHLPVISKGDNSFLRLSCVEILKFRLN